MALRRAILAPAPTVLLIDKIDRADAELGASLRAELRFPGDAGSADLNLPLPRMGV